jgi:hypothetical protein
MKFLTAKNLKDLPALYANEARRPADVSVPVKFFTPWSSWTWYATEYDPKEGIFFGLVDGHEAELGYFSRSELESVTGPMGLKIERDMHWRGTLADAYRISAH